MENKNYYLDLKKIDRILSGDPSGDALKHCLELLKEDEIQEYFFNKLSDNKWFLYLNSNSLFDLKLTTLDIKDSNFWKPLHYLEKVSKHLEKHPEYLDPLFQIIENAMRYYSKNARSYNPWWFLKVLLNFPNDYLGENLGFKKFNELFFEGVNIETRSSLFVSDLVDKFIPKFIGLANDPLNKSTIKFAEEIIKKIIQIKSSNKKPSYTRNTEAELLYASESYYIRKAFEGENGLAIGKICSREVIDHISQTLKKALDYKRHSCHKTLEKREHHYQIILSNVYENKEKLLFKSDAYRVSLKKYSEAQLKNVNRESELWFISAGKPEETVIEFIINAPDQERLIFCSIDELKKKHIDIVNLFSEAYLKDEIKKLYLGLNSPRDYSQVWCKTIKNGPSFTNGAEEALTKILIGVLPGKLENDLAVGKDILESFLSKEYPFPIFKRLALFFIDQYWDKYKILSQHIFENLKELTGKSEYEFELFVFLKNHYSDFSVAQKGLLKQSIENDVPEHIKADPSYVPRWKFKWLSALKDDPVFQAEYKQLCLQSKQDENRPYEPMMSSISFSESGTKSPLTSEELLKMPNIDIVRYLNDFKGANQAEAIFDGKPDIQGLANVLQATVQDKPEYFQSELSVYHDAPYFFVVALVRGFAEAYRQGKELGWDYLIDYFESYLQKNLKQEMLRDQGEDSGDGKYVWIAEEISRLIEDASKNDERSYPPASFEKIESIFSLMMKMPVVDTNPDTNKDSVSYALNTTIGRIIQAYIHYSLRVARVSKLEKKLNWGSEKYERFFKVSSIEAYVWLGQYLRNIHYLDAAYAKNKISAMNKLSVDDLSWKAFMEGYLSAPFVDEALYPLMEINYKKAIDKKIFDEHDDERLVQHMVIGYIRDYESLDSSSLFRKMLDDADTPEKALRWTEVARFMWFISPKKVKNIKTDDEESKKLSEKIIEFWEWVEKNKGSIATKLGSEWGVFLAQLALLTIYLNHINEKTEEWLKTIIEYQHQEFGVAFFIEYLNKFEDDESVRRLSFLFNTLVEKFTPTFREEDIRKLVEKQYALWQKDKSQYQVVKENADNICNTYGRRGFHFLRSLWEQNNG